MPDQVRLDVRLRVLEAVADSGLRAEMHNTVDINGIGKALERLGVREIDTLEPETIAELLLQVCEPRLLQFRIVIIVEIVDSDDLVAALEQNARRRRTDETCSSRNQYSHGRSLGG